MGEEGLLKHLPVLLKHPKIVMGFQVLIVFGGIYTGLVGLKEIFFVSIDLITSTTWRSVNMNTIGFYGVSVGWLWSISFDVIVILVFSAAAYIIIQKNQVEIAKWKQKAKDEELKTQTWKLTTKMFKFAEERKNSYSFIDGPWQDPELNEAQKQKAWGEHTKQIVGSGNETVGIYNREYYPEVSRIRQEFANRNVSDPELDIWYANPTNPLGIEDVAQKLLELANKLP